jgi:hypothetical protein
VLSSFFWVIPYDRTSLVVLYFLGDSLRLNKSCVVFFLLGDSLCSNKSCCVVLFLLGDSL